MNNNWIKKGLIYNVEGFSSWNKTHGQVPVVDSISNETLRIYYASRDKNGKSRTSFIEVDSDNPKKVKYIHKNPILELGSIGSFDDSGIMPSSIINVGKLKYLYYIGWTTRGSVPFSNSIGLAISKDGGKSFQKRFAGPIIGVGPNEPYFTGTCYVIKYKDKFLAYYLSCIGWKKINNNKEPFYDIKIASSVDGLKWIPINKTAISLVKDEGGIASASVLNINDKFCMWFSVRGGIDYRDNPLSSYKIGYAESVDGIKWERKESNIIPLSKNGWDSKMLAYPNVIKKDDSLKMFYNGNGFGRTGFGYAEMKIKWN